MSRRLCHSCLAVILLVLSSSARANLAVSFDTQPIVQGGTGTLNIFVTSDATTTPDMINQFGFQLLILGPHELQFAPNPSFDYVTSISPPYIFSGDSSGPTGAPDQTTYPNDTYNGVDSTQSGNPVSLTQASGTLLLASVKLDATITDAGDVYTFQLVPDSGMGSLNQSSNTFFDNFDFDTGTELSAVPYTSLPGTVTIIPAAVPEPTSVILLLTGIAPLALRRLRPAKMA